MKEESIELTLKENEIPTVPHHPVMTEQFVSLYREAIRLSKLQLDNHIKYRNVLIYEKEHIHEVFTVQDKKLPHLVLLHGYGGTSLTYIRCFEHLRNYFHIHALDTFGVGLSSLGNWKDEHTPEEAANYYVDAIEEWRKSLGLKEFILAGHSFGGYISTLYLQKYPQSVKQLILLSPAGSTFLTEQKIKERASRSRFFFCMAQKVYNMNIRPSKVMNTWWIGNKFIDRILRNRLKLPEEEQPVWRKYLKAISSIQNNSEKGFYRLFQWPLQPHRSIETIINTIKPRIKIDFLFGDSDWMQTQGAYRLEKENKQQINVHVINNSGHQLLFDNPVQLTQKIKDIAK